MNWTTEKTTLTGANYQQLRKAGILPERAYPSAAEWAMHGVTILGHEYQGGKLWIELEGSAGNRYRKEFHLARSAA